jgi:hypothetical protein
MPKGRYRIRDGWGTEHSVCVEYEDRTRLEMGESLYRLKRYQPPIEELPWQDKGGKN